MAIAGTSAKTGIPSANMLLKARGRPHIQVYEFDILQTFGVIGCRKESRLLDLFFLNAMVVQRAFRRAEVAFLDTVSTWVGN